jgi:hypothetical protein
MSSFLIPVKGDSHTLLLTDVDMLHQMVVCDIDIPTTKAALDALYYLTQTGMCVIVPLSESLICCLYSTGEAGRQTTLETRAGNRSAGDKQWPCAQGSQSLLAHPRVPVSGKGVGTAGCPECPQVGAPGTSSSAS